MTQALREEQKVWNWIQDQNMAEVSRKTGVSLSRIHYFKEGKAKHPAFLVVRELMILMEKEK